ncbi:MAG: TrmH family RNA methyltransferase, partial [Allomuricauda sp.]
MVTKNQIKLVTSLQQKKYRSQHGLFVVEGKKSVYELLAEGLVPFKIFVDPALKGLDFGDVVTATTRELKQMSGQTTPSGVLGVFHMPEPKKAIQADWIVALDAVRDPGNLGTIIRLCDWFGIKHLVCSPDTVDCYNPKVLQATMGSIARVQIDYMELPNFLKTTGLPIYGAFMDGETVYQEVIPDKGVLIMGNEANGISKEVEQAIAKRVSIPQFGTKSAESLNVATATAILLNE